MIFLSSVLIFCPRILSHLLSHLLSPSHKFYIRRHRPQLTQPTHSISKTSILPQSSSHPSAHMPYPSTPTYRPESPTTSSPIPCTNPRFRSSGMAFAALETQSFWGDVPPPPPGTPNEYSPPTAWETQSYWGDIPPAPPGTPNELPIHPLHPESPSGSLSDTRSESGSLIPDTSSGAQSHQDSETPADAAEATQSAENHLSGLTESFHAFNIAVVVVGPGYSGPIVPRMDPPTPPLTPPIRGLGPPTPPLTPP